MLDHELYHFAQATDRFGAPRFNEATGRPRFCIKRHDVEEFVGVVRRFGVLGESMTSLMIAASEAPEVAPAKLAQSCGTCLRLVA